METVEWIMALVAGVVALLFGNTLRNITSAIEANNQGIDRCRDAVTEVKDDLMTKIDGVYVRMHGVEQNVSDINGQVKQTALWRDMHEKMDDERFSGLKSRFDKNDSDHDQLLKKIECQSGGSRYD